MSRVIVEAEPEPISLNLDRTALVIIDMQRDFLEPGGFGETLGNDVSLLQAAVGPCRRALGVARANGGWVVVPVDFRAHGKDERLPVQSLYDNVVHWQMMAARERFCSGTVEVWTRANHRWPVVSATRARGTP